MATFMKLANRTYPSVSSIFDCESGQRLKLWLIINCHSSRDTDTKNFTIVHFNPLHLFWTATCHGWHVISVISRWKDYLAHSPGEPSTFCGHGSSTLLWTSTATATVQHKAKRRWWLQLLRKLFCKFIIIPLSTILIDGNSRSERDVSKDGVLDHGRRILEKSRHSSSDQYRGRLVEGEESCPRSHSFL